MAAQALGDDIAQRGAALMAAVGEKLGAALVEHAVEGSAKRLERIQRRVGDQGVQGHGAVAGRVVGASPLEVEQPVDERRERRRRPLRACARRRLAHERAAPDGGLHQALAGEGVVGEGYGVAVDTQLPGQSADGGQLVARAQLTGADGPAHLLGDLLVDGLAGVGRAGVVALDGDLHGEQDSTGTMSGQSDNLPPL